MKPTVKKLKNVRGRITGYAALIGEVRAEGPTPAAASEACERLVAEALERLDRGTLIAFWRGHTYVISPTTNGWQYWIDTFSRDGYSVSLGKVDREGAQDAALGHLAQNLWSVDVADDDDFLVGLPKAVASETARWIRFQRSYAALRAEGKSDVEAHRLAVSA